MEVFSRLHRAISPGAEAFFSPTGRGTLRLPAGPPNRYRLAQWDDYRGLARAQFPWRPPLTFCVSARATHPVIPGTWGFGLWNDPMSLSIGFGSKRKLPALPNTAWFFFASCENHLSFRNDLPGNGALAATFRAPHLPALLLTSGLLAFPLLLWRPMARLLRRLTSKIIRQDGVSLNVNPVEWHAYKLRWESNQVTFWVDDDQVFATSISPRGPLGLVIWIDNQYAAWNPDGGLKWGLLEGKESFAIEIEELEIS